MAVTVTTPTAQASADAVRMLQRATELARGGDAATARRLLAEVCFLDPQNEAAWLWRASLATSMPEGRAFLQEVLRLNPANETAIAWMNKIESRVRAPQAAKSASPAPAEDPWKPKEGWASGAPPKAAPPAPAPAPAAPAPVAGPVHPGGSPSPDEGAAANTSGPAPCPFCHHAAETAQPAACANCHALLKLDSAAAFALNRNLDRAAVTAAVELLGVRRSGMEIDDEIALALGYLNLLDYHRAAIHLQQAHSLDALNARLDGEHLLRYLVRPVVMVVDDSATVREYIVRILGQNDFLPVPVANSWETIELITAHRPSLVLLDVTMPMMDGHQVCRAIRGKKEIRNLPVVMLSGHDDLLDKVVGRMAGATEYLTKPFKPEQLLKTVRKYAKDRAIR